MAVSIHARPTAGRAAREWRFRHDDESRPSACEARRSMAHCRRHRASFADAMIGAMGFLLGGAALAVRAAFMLSLRCRRRAATRSAIYRRSSSAPESRRPRHVTPLLLRHDFVVPRLFDDAFYLRSLRPRARGRGNLPPIHGLGFSTLPGAAACRFRYHWRRRSRARRCFAPGDESVSRIPAWLMLMMGVDFMAI